MTELINKLKDKKLKITPQRLAVYKYLVSTTEHPSVEMIYNALKEDYPNMSLATVYKNVAVLKAAGLVRELSVGEDYLRYDADVSEHIHLVCTKCHCVSDYYGKVLSGSESEKIEAKTGFEVVSSDLSLFGICKNCNRKK
jgi:Fur family peroxide stress response transcriptional regulator